MEQPCRKTKTTTTLKEFLTSIATDDILFEIFTRLRNPTSVGHCAAVCKRWRSVISNPKFTSMFKKCPSRSPPFTLMLRDGDSYLSDKPDVCLDLFSGPAIPNYLEYLPAKCVIKASCNDLLLVELSTPRHLRVCHPITHQWAPLPEPPALPEDYTTYGIRNFRYIRKTSISYGFVRDPNSGKNYTVLEIVTSYREEKLCVSVFRSETGRWDESIRKFPLGPELYHLTLPVGTCDGLVYVPLVGERWIFKKIAVVNPFDISMGLGYREVNLPVGFKRGWRASRKHVRIWVVRGGVRLWQSYFDKKMGNKFVLKAWNLNGKYGDWSQLYDLKISTKGEPVSKFTSSSSVMVFHPEDDNVFYFKDLGPSIWRYHIGTGNCQKIGEVSCRMKPDAVPYIVLHEPLPTQL